MAVVPPSYVKRIHLSLSNSAQCNNLYRKNMQKLSGYLDMGMIKAVKKSKQLHLKPISTPATKVKKQQKYLYLM